nr:Hint domain-containing protein [Octadecabacter temperatus]
MFIYGDGSGHDTVIGFDLGDSDSEGFTNDQLDVSASTNGVGDPVTSSDVTVSDDGSGNAVLTFPNGESITLGGVAPASIPPATLVSMGVPCFKLGTLIRTPDGDRPVETLRPGDLVTTLELGSEPVRWIASSDLGGSAALPENTAPVRIKSGTIGNARP